MQLRVTAMFRALKGPSTSADLEVDVLLAVERREWALLAARAPSEVVGRRQSYEPYFEIPEFEVRCSRHRRESAKVGGQRDVAGCASHA